MKLRKKAYSNKPVTLKVFKTYIEKDKEYINNLEIIATIRRYARNNY